MARAFRSDRSWAFDAPVDDLWRRITETDRFRHWWPWLHRFDAGDGFEQGATWRCEVAPPLPYVVRFDLHLDRVEPCRHVATTLSGGIRGTARLDIESATSNDRAAVGCRARLRSSLEPVDPILRGVATIARPMVGWGHDWVLDQGLRQFVAAW